MRRNLDNFSAHWTAELAEWKATGHGGEEQKSAQRFWIDLFACFGVSAARMDLFERHARRASTGGAGRIDLFWPSMVLGEAKRPGVDLDVAQEQALDYLNGGSVGEHELPRYIICSNFERLRVTRLGEAGFETEFALADIADHVDALKFLAGYDTVTKAEEQAASIKASRLMAELFTAMVGDEVDEAVGDEAPTNPAEEDAAVQETSMYLTRLLFLLFGDDAGLWEADLFARFVEESTTPETLGAQLNALFEVLNTPEERRRRVPESMAAFPYVNGAIFAEPMRTQYFNAAMHEALLKACRFDWSKISPAIFGSLFQLVKSKEARRAAGEHYTSEKNILKTLKPLFLDELRAEATRLIAAPSTRVPRLREFRDSLAEMVFCDPACGSGNFLIVAYRELRKIETDIIVEIRNREGLGADQSLDITWEQKLSINQFHGFELNWWPARIAETAMFLVDHQANAALSRRIGQQPERLPIRVTAHIVHGNALEMDWTAALPPAEVTYVFGNPPFAGRHTKSKQQKTELQQVWGDNYNGNLDYSTGWHAQALRLFATRRGEFAFVTTNSITQGEQPHALFPPLYRAGWAVKFAHRTFAWDSEVPGKAAVHCVIVGFTRDRDTKLRLWDYPEVKGDPVEQHVTTGINAYLLDAPQVLVTKRSKPLSPVLSRFAYGSKPSDGNNLTPKSGTPRPVHDPVAMKYVRPFVMGRELLHDEDRWCFWLVDAVPGDIKRSPVLHEAVSAVKRFRLASVAASTRAAAATPSLFRQIGQPETDYIAVPRVSSESRMFYPAKRMSAEIICGDKVYTAEDPDGLMFALFSSSMFITWQRAVGGRLKSDLSFSNTIVWNNFPVPALSDKQRAAIIRAGQKVLDARALHPERSLAEHYAPLAMEPELVKAHAALDREVDTALGAPRKLTTEKQRLEVLFKNYVALTAD